MTSPRNCRQWSYTWINWKRLSIDASIFVTTVIFRSSLTLIIVPHRWYAFLIVSGSSNNETMVSNSRLISFSMGYWPNFFRSFDNHFSSIHIDWDGQLFSDLVLLIYFFIRWSVGIVLKFFCMMLWMLWRTTSSHVDRFSRRLLIESVYLFCL